MDEHGELRALLDLAESVGIVIRRAPPGPDASAGQAHPGGALVRLRDREMLFLDPAASVADRIAVVAAALTGRKEIDDLFIPPQVRRRIEQT